MKKIIVVKIGSSIATTKRGKVDEYRFAQLAQEIQRLLAYGFGVVLVVSGAVWCGSRGKNVSKQLAAGIGQAYLIGRLYEVFEKNHLCLAQMLLTKKDILERKQSIISVISEAVEKNIIVVLNENDILELNSFQGNDFLAAEIATKMQAERLLLLTDVNGVLDQNKSIIKTLQKDAVVDLHMRTNKMQKSIGGIVAKVLAARNAAKNNIATTIANGKTKNILSRIILGKESIGTQVL